MMSSAISALAERRERADAARRVVGARGFHLHQHSESGRARSSPWLRITVQRAAAGSSWRCENSERSSTDALASLRSTPARSLRQQHDADHATSFARRFARRLSSSSATMEQQRPLPRHVVAADDRQRATRLRRQSRRRRNERPVAPARAARRARVRHHARRFTAYTAPPAPSYPFVGATADDKASLIEHQHATTKSAARPPRTSRERCAWRAAAR